VIIAGAYATARVARKWLPCAALLTGPCRPGRHHDIKAMEQNRWQRLRSRTFITLAGITRGMTLGVRTMLVDGDKVLLVRHTYVPGWHFPGGGVERGETAEASAAREVFEESGYRITGPLEVFGFYFNGRTHPRDHVVLYLSRSFETAYAFAPTWEIAEAGWFDRAALPEDTTGGTRRRMAEVFEDAPKAAHW
jgi:ADP-ribose pyrophosphatase YjhB (NUDIX family)